MSAAYGPRTYLIGRLLPELVRQYPDRSENDIADAIVRYVDATLDAMSFDWRLTSGPSRADRPHPGADPATGGVASSGVEEER